MKCESQRCDLESIDHFYSPDSETGDRKPGVLGDGVMGCIVKRCEV